ncbi:hypothetical protein [Paenibacillus sp. R14(2021)]|uniref:hypothetical protein n=1 Tax=Paenibacillus sp. R14(2021) TaxID=2859228 RepID=UPI001C61691D|nr:hypothetical protein [Paenibacillus sp. R14(2021)]
MEWLELITALIGLVVIIYYFYYDRKFIKEEGMDERGAKILGLSSRMSFSYVSGMISILILADVFFDFPLQVYKLLVFVILILSSVISLISLSRLRKDY